MVLPIQSNAKQRRLLKGGNRSRMNKLFYIHRGSFSGINDALLRAWSKDRPDLRIETCDLNTPCYGGMLGKVRAIPARVILWGLRRRMEWPLKLICPESGR